MLIRRRRRLKLSEAEREKMRTACAFNAELLDVVRPHVKAGVTTAELDNLVHEYSRSDSCFYMRSHYG